MKDTEIFTQLLGLETPWHVSDVTLDEARGQITIQVLVADDAKLICPTCGLEAPRYDRRPRQWRHLDTLQYITIIHANLPRIQCSEHGVVTVDVPWAASGTRFTELFEAMVIAWLKEASVAAVSRLLRLSWGSIDRIMNQAVERGLARREALNPRRLCVDETSFQKRHEYVTVVTDPDAGCVLHIADDRKTGSLESFFQSLNEDQKAKVLSISMDMWPAFIKATREHIPNADEKICFDKFHVAQMLNKATDQVRRAEHRSLLREGPSILTRSKYQWLTNTKNMGKKQLDRFAELRDSTLKTARAWAIKQLAMELWSYRSRAWALKAWNRWLGWATRSRLEPVRAAAKTIKNHLWGIINAIVLDAHNGHAESMNSRIQRIKQRACGFRNRERFRTAIYFHLGGLDLSPKRVKV